MFQTPGYQANLSRLPTNNTNDPRDYRSIQEIRPRVSSSVAFQASSAALPSKGCQRTRNSAKGFLQGPAMENLDKEHGW